MSVSPPTHFRTLRLNVRREAYRWLESQAIEVNQVWNNVLDAAYNRCVPTSDRREGISAARAKRSPKFTGS
jgi:hypothetical protein